MADQRSPIRQHRASLGILGVACVAFAGAFYLSVVADPGGQDGAAAPEYAAPVDSVREMPANEHLVPADRVNNVAHRTPREWSETEYASSLEGTEIDGHLRADEEGRLIVELAVRDLFDYFLNTAEDVGPDQAIDRIEQLANSYLPDSAAEQAMELLDQYLAYKERAIEVGNQPLAERQSQTVDYQMRMLEKGLEELKQARREIFPDSVVSAFFGNEEAYGDYTLARMRIEQRDDLSREEKNQRIRLEQEQLPEVVRRSEERMFEAQQQQQRVARIMTESASPDEAAEELRQMGLSEERVAAITGRMAERASFDQQYQTYLEEKRRLDEAGYSEDDREQRLQALRDEHFEDEAARSRAEIRDLGDDFAAE